MSKAPSDAPSKALHDLHEAASADELETRLSRHGISLDAVLAHHGVDTSRDGVLLVGSLAEGIGTPSSDVDLMVLVEDSQLALPAEAVALRMRWSTEFLAYEQDIEINGEILARTAFADALRAFLEIVPALYDLDSLGNLPVVDPSERNLLHRLLSGWPIRGHQVVRRWRDEFLVVMFPPYLALLRFIEFREYLEDAAAMRGTSDGSFTLAVRDGATEALFSLLALSGVTNQQTRWLPRLVARAGNGDNELVGELMECLFLPRRVTVSQQDEVLGRLRRAGERVRHRLDTDPHLETAASAVADRIRYAND